jgi:16S rRNA (uracil1498-N3)-methyltransferase
MELFYNNIAHNNIDEIKFDDFESNHILKSKRKKIGEEIQFTNGKGGLFKGKIRNLKPKVISSCQLIKIIPPAEKKITLAVGFIRSNRLDFLFEKITEIGISKIILFSSKNANYFTTNIEHWIKITRQAIKQSLRYYLPEIETIENFKTLIDNSSKYIKQYITDQSAETRLSDISNQIQDKKINNIIYVIGPEGGLTENEMNYAIAKGFTNVNLGLYRLRTETAALVFGSYLNLNIH